MTFSPAYIEKRLIACRELAAQIQSSEYRAAILSGVYDDHDCVTRHFPAVDAGSAQAVAAIVEWLQECSDEQHHKGHGREAVVLADTADAIECGDYQAVRRDND